MMFCLTLTGGQTIAATARRIASRSSGPTLSWLVLLRSSVPRSRDSTQWTEASFSSTWSARCQSALTVPLVRWESSISWAKLCASSSLTAVSGNFLRRLCTAVQSGAKEAPVDGRSTRQHRNRPAEQSVDSFFAFLHQYVAEPLAEGMQSSSEDGEIEMDLEDALGDQDSCEMDDYSQWIMGHPVGGVEQVKNGSTIAAFLTSSCSTSSISCQMVNWRPQPGKPSSTGSGVKNGEV